MEMTYYHDQIPKMYTLDNFGTQYKLLAVIEMYNTLGLIKLAVSVYSRGDLAYTVTTINRFHCIALYLNVVQFLV